MNEYLKNKGKNKIDFSIDRGLNKKLPALNRDKSILNPKNELELDTLQVTDSIAVKDREADNTPYLNELFERAFQLVTKHQRRDEAETDMDTTGANVGLDFYAGGRNHAIMSYAASIKKNDGSANKPPVVVDQFVGNVGAARIDNENDMKFAKQFQAMIEIGFKYFGKRYNQLGKEDLKLPSDAGFKVTEKNQYPAITFDDGNAFTADVVITKFVEYSLKNFGPQLLNKKIKELCISFPSDFDTAQRTELRQLLNRLGIKKCSLITKPIAIATPILLTRPNDNIKNLVVDYSSGYLSSTLMTTKDKTITINDRIVNKKIATDAFMKKFVSTALLELQKNGSQLKDPNRVRNELEKALDAFAQKLEGSSKPNEVPSTLELEIDGKKIQLDLNLLGGEKLAQETEQSMREAKLELPFEANFRLILSANPAIARFLVPKLAALYPNAELILKTSEYSATIGASALVQQAKFGIETCDLLPYNVGISLYNGIIMKLIDGKSNYPCVGSHTFNSVTDNQKSIRVICYEGDRQLSRNCKPVCELLVRNLPPALAGGVRCQITLNFDHNGVLTPYARDMESKKNLPVETNVSPQLMNVKKSAVDSLVLASSADTEEDKALYAAVDEIDLFMEYLVYISKDIPKAAKEDVTLKVSRAKNYINAHKNELTLEHCEQLKLELEECADNNNLSRRKSIAVPASQVFKNSNTNKGAADQSKTCVIS